MTNFLSILLFVVISALQLLFGVDMSELASSKGTAAVTEGAQAEVYRTLPVKLDKVECGMSEAELASVLGSAEAETSDNGTRTLTYKIDIDTIIGKADSVSFTFGETPLTDLSGEAYELGLSIIEVHLSDMNYEQTYERLESVYGALEHTSMLATAVSDNADETVCAERLGSPDWRIDRLSDAEGSALEALFKKNSPDYILLPEELLASIYIMGESKDFAPVTVRFDVTISQQLMHAVD